MRYVDLQHATILLFFHSGAMNPKKSVYYTVYRDPVNTRKHFFTKTPTPTPIRAVNIVANLFIGNCIPVAIAAPHSRRGNRDAQRILLLLILIVNKFQSVLTLQVFRPDHTWARKMR